MSNAANMVGKYYNSPRGRETFGLENYNPARDQGSLHSGTALEYQTNFRISSSF